MLNKRSFGVVIFALAAFVSVPLTADTVVKGFVGDKLNACIQNHVLKTSPEALARVFTHRSGTVDWQSEFWGKYMLSAVPIMRYLGDDVLKERIARSVAIVLSAQQSDGYIGTYKPDCRAGEGWDVWGMKYTLLGLLEYHSATRDKTALDAAKKLADYLLVRFENRDLRKSGNFRGLPSCSILGAFVRLYHATRDERYYLFARRIAEEVDAADGPRLVRDALAGIPVASRPTDGTVKGSGLKAYEMMSCYQGLLMYADLVEQKGGAKELAGNLRAAVLAAARSISSTEINITGGGAANEVWFGGAAKETSPYGSLQETCVLTTWMRLCEMLLIMTDDPSWADEIEKTFYNAFLASMRPDVSEFAQYCPLAGTRSSGNSHSRLHTNCCNANGPRGFLPILNSLATAAESKVTFNFYTSADVSLTLPGNSRTADFELFTLFPRTNGFPPYWDGTQVRYVSAEPASFEVRMRIPAWSEKTIVRLNGKELAGVKAGAYYRINRIWSCGDSIEIVFDMRVKRHEKNGFVAFSAGPLALARDSRFGDGQLATVVRRAGLDGVDFVQVRPPSAAYAAVYAAALPMGLNEDNAFASLPSVVRFADFASAGNTWDDDSSYSVWLPLAEEAKR